MSRRDLDYETFDNDYRGFDMSDEENARGPLILALALGVLLVFGAVVWNTYRQGVRSGAGDVPIIVADSAPYKRAPDDRGGLQDNDLNKRIYDQIDGSTRDMEPRSIGYDVAANDIDDTRDGPGGPPIELRPGSEENGVEPNEPVAEQIDALNDLAGAAPAEAEASPQRLAALPETPKAAPTAMVSAPAPQAMFIFDERGAFLVQIAAFRSEEAAETEWAKVTAAAPDTFMGAEKRVQRADLGSKGVFYRLRAGAFADRAEASSFCEAVKTTGRQCIVVAE